MDAIVVARGAWNDLSIAVPSTPDVFERQRFWWLPVSNIRWLQPNNSA
jgi:hypothetical protein